MVELLAVPQARLAVPCRRRQGIRQVAQAGYLPLNPMLFFVEADEGSRDHGATASAPE